MGRGKVGVKGLVNSARAVSSKAKGLGLLSGLGTIQVDETNLAQLEKINSTLQTLIKQEATKPKKVTRTRSGSGVKRQSNTDLPRQMLPSKQSVPKAQKHNFNTLNPNDLYEG